ncbi:PucR family transcriptional regulator [Phytoactinopolyspora halotolerans]|uniref:PucR family transcriptional regulator n=1 Tax=Phytoactinopolyspora halotolerans TaxID=1981512 RepID=A0A6L9SE86_9ACTN|nr:PucR family transcriptional regulator [Phytoactinopolyspora halotolerans]NEE03735.1 PucR family transcriptional regulator [Phytoactinopolyspora halotolerans]
MFTIASLVADRSLRLRLLVSGAPGAVDEPVRWVHNTELLDPSPYLRERELVMTNGLWFQGAESAAEFVGHVQRAGGAGIVFGLRTQTPATPAELVDACRAADVALLELAVSVPFTELSRAAADAYAEQRQQELTRTVRRSDALADSVSRGGGVAGVLEVLGRDHPELETAVVDRMGRHLAGAALDDRECRRVAEALAAHPPPLDVRFDRRGPAAVFLCGALGGADAALICLTAMDQLDAGQRAVVEQAAKFVSLELARTQLAQAIEMRFSSELLDMVSSTSTDERLVADRLEGFGIDPEGWLTAWAIAVADPVSAASTSPNPSYPGAVDPGSVNPGSVDTTPMDLVEAVREFFVVEATPAVVAGGPQDVAVILPARGPDDDVTAMAKRLATSLGDGSGTGVAVGLGSVGTGVGTVRTALHQARETCRVLRRRPPGARVASFDSLGTYHMLLGLQDPATLRRFAWNVVGPIRRHDDERGSELEATVRAFLDHDGHWAQTAEALHVHVNTLRNRIAKIAELCGRDVMRTEDRVDLFLALRAIETADARDHRGFRGL